MATSEERLKVLRMVQEGKITAEQGLKLLSAVQEPVKATPTPVAPPLVKDEKQARWLRIRVTDTNTGKNRVNIRLPINVVTAGFKMGARFSPEIQGLDTKQLMDMIRSGETGQVVDIRDDKDGEHVEVYLE